jgi:hypothetical protein
MNGFEHISYDITNKSKTLPNIPRDSVTQIYPITNPKDAALLSDDLEKASCPSK